MDYVVLKDNEVRVVGILTEVDLNVRHSAKTGKEFIAGTIVVKSNIEGREQLTEVELFSNATRLDGAPNQLFATYQGLENKIGSRVSVVGEIEENRFFQEGSAQVASYNRIRGKWINNANANESDTAEFDFAGYVAHPITERVNQDGDLLFYEITLAQANYSNEFPIYAKFNIRDANIARVVNNLYEKGATVKVQGEYVVEVEETEYKEETAFGDPITKTRTSTFRNFTITSGTVPTFEGDIGAYPKNFIEKLDAEYIARGEKLELAAKNKVANSFQKTGSAKSSLGKALL